MSAVPAIWFTMFFSCFGLLLLRDIASEHLSNLKVKEQPCKVRRQS